MAEGIPEAEVTYHIARMFDTVRQQPQPQSQRDQLVVNNIGLVAMIAKKLNRGPVTDDQIQEGMVGLIRAADTFDPERGCKFSSYACRCIWSAMVRAHINSKRKSVRSSGMDPVELASVLVDHQAVQPLDAVDQTERRQISRNLIAKALNHMREDDRVAVYAKYARGETLSEIGERWGVSKERIRQRIARGIKEACRAMGVPVPTK